MILMVEDVALAVASTVESARDVEGWLAVQSELIVEFAQVLEVGFIDDLRADDLRVADLQSVLDGVGVVTESRQCECTDALVILIIAIILIACGQGVVFGEGIVEPG